MSQWIDRGAAAQTAQQPGKDGFPEAGASPLLTVIVPVFNEAATVNELLRRVVAVPLDMRVIVVDDGSTDGTTVVLEGWEGHPLVELLAHSRNRGKGAAVRTGLEHAQGRYAIVQDADLEYDPRDIPRLLAPLLAGQADAVYGSRYMGEAARGRARSLNAASESFKPTASARSFSSRLRAGPAFRLACSAHGCAIAGPRSCMARRADYSRTACGVFARMFWRTRK